MGSKEQLSRGTYYSTKMTIICTLFNCHLSNVICFFLHQDHRESHQNYRERDLPLRTRTNHVQRSRTPPNTYRNDHYDQNHSQKSSKLINITPRGIPNRPPSKRLSESSDKELQEVSPKRSKTPNKRNLQEVRRIDTSGEIITEKKVRTLFYRKHFLHDSQNLNMQNYNFRMKITIQRCKSIVRKWKNRSVLEKSYYAKKRTDVKWLQWRNKMRIQNLIRALQVSFTYIFNLYLCSIKLLCTFFFSTNMTKQWKFFSD